jgi:hypothetical protein
MRQEQTYLSTQLMAQLVMMIKKSFFILNETPEENR